MKTYTLKSAAAKLKTTPFQVKRMIKAGVLTDVATPKEGAVRHHARITSSSIKLLLESNKPVYARRVKSKPIQVEETVKPLLGLGIHSRLDSIEAKLDKLVALWS